MNLYSPGLNHARCCGVNVTMSLELLSDHSFWHVQHHMFLQVIVVRRPLGFDLVPTLAPVFFGPSPNLGPRLWT